jgi:uncharacterized membrane protein YqjE
MALLQAILAFVGRSAGRILNAIFGWAVRALFGSTRGAQELLLTTFVAAAALWPLLLLGVAAPRIAAFVLTFVPIPETFPATALRAGWALLALVVPLALGIAVAAKSPRVAESEPFALRALRGAPITLGISIAFWMSFVTVPLRRVASLARWQSEAHVPLITKGDAYVATAARIERALDAHGFASRRVTPPLSVRAPMTVMRKLGGAALRGYVPERLAHFVAADLEATLHPSSLLLRGPTHRVALAHGIVVEALASCDALQTTDPDAQDLERQIRRVWRVLREHPAHLGSPVLAKRIDEIARDLVATPIAYQDWETVYRQLLQLARAVRGEPQLLQASVDDDAGAATMETSRNDRAQHELRDNGAAELPIGALMREIASKMTQLAAKEVELARVEMKQDLASVLTTLKSFAVAAVFAITALNLLIVACVWAIAERTTLEGWAVAAIAAGVAAGIAAAAAWFGWRKRPAEPLERTRRTLQEDIRWAM